MDIIINNDILEKAENIIKKENQKKIEEENKYIYIKKCIEAKICPICGEPLFVRNPTKEEEKNSIYNVIEHVLYCKKSKFIHIQGYYDDDYDD